MRKTALLLCALMMAFLVSCHDERQELRSCDLVFVEGSADGAMDRAIMGSTGQMVHVGIVEVQDDSIFVIDAAPKTGVSRRALDEFIEAQSNANGTVPTMKVMRVNDGLDTEACLNKAKSFIGTPYDFTFLPDNGFYYCSELVYDCFRKDGNPVFDAVPMNFKNTDGGFDPYWTNLFGALGMEVPQGVMGTNPNDLFHSPVLKHVETVHAPSLQ